MYVPASVCTQLAICRPPNPRMDRPVADTTPVVNVLSNPNGLPMANTVCPTCKSCEVPTGKAGGIEATPLSFKTAKSFSGSTPTTVASRDSTIPGNLTLTVRGTRPSAVTTTCAFVTTCPAASHKNPDPDPVAISSGRKFSDRLDEDTVVMNATDWETR